MSADEVSQLAEEAERLYQRAGVARKIAIERLRIMQLDTFSIQQEMTNNGDMVTHIKKYRNRGGNNPIAGVTRAATALRTVLLNSTLSSLLGVVGNGFMCMYIIAITCTSLLLVLMGALFAAIFNLMRVSSPQESKKTNAKDVLNQQEKAFDTITSAAYYVFGALSGAFEAASTSFDKS